MQQTIEIYGQKFMLTNDFYDPTDMDFRFYANVKITRNLDGTPSLKQYYMNYDPATNTFSDLAVQCVYTYTLDITQKVTKRVEDITWYFIDNTVGTTRELIKVYA